MVSFFVNCLKTSPFYPQITPQITPHLPPDYPQITPRFTPSSTLKYGLLDLPYILKSRFDCAFFFFDSHINLNHLLIMNFLSNLYTSEKKFVCGYFQLLFVCELSEMASSKKLQKLFLIRIFFFIKKIKIFEIFWYSAKLNGTYAEAINKQNQHFNAAWTHLTYAVLHVPLSMISKVWLILYVMQFMICSRTMHFICSKIDSFEKIMQFNLWKAKSKIWWKNWIQNHGWNNEMRFQNILF